MASWAQNSRSGRLWGGLGGSLGGHFERCWLEVGLSWLMLELCCDISGDKMAAKMAILAIKSAKMSQDGAQEAATLSQDKPGLRIRGLERSGEVLGVSWRPF